MIVKTVLYSSRFIKELKLLPQDVLTITARKERIFKENPLHPSLRLHPLSGKLKGLWSISISGSYRIIFEREVNGDILFISVGKHDIYKYL